MGLNDPCGSLLTQDSLLVYDSTKPFEICFELYYGLLTTTKISNLATIFALALSVHFVSVILTCDAQANSNICKQLLRLHQFCRSKKQKPVKVSLNYVVFISQDLNSHLSGCI